MRTKPEPCLMEIFGNFAQMEHGLKNAWFFMQKLDVISVTITEKGIEVLMIKEQFFYLFGDIASEMQPTEDGTMMFRSARAFGIKFIAFFNPESQS